MNDSDPDHIRASHTVQQWNHDREAARWRDLQHQARNGGASTGGYGSGAQWGAWVVGAGMLGFFYGMTFSKSGEFFSMIGYGLLTGFVCMCLVAVVKKAIGGGLLLAGITLLGIKNLIGGIFGFVFGKGATSAGGAIARAAIRGSLIGGLAGAGIALALQDSVGDAALRVGTIGAGIAVFLRVLSMARGKDTSA